MKSVKELKLKDLKGKKVLVRCDFDVPLENGKVVDDFRLKASLETVEYLISKKAKIILMGHFGRPKGEFVSNLSLLVVAKYYQGLINKRLSEKGREKIDLKFVGNFQLPGAKEDFKKQESGEIFFLENIRFWIGEKKNDKRLAKNLSLLADIFVNEAFAVSHRKAASISAIQDYLPSYAGINLMSELKTMNSMVRRPSRPLVAIIGGAKIETKLPVIERFFHKADYLLVGGAIANNFLKVLGVEVGKSLIDEDYLKDALRLISKSQKGILQKETEITQPEIESLELKEIQKLKHKIILPIDVWVEDQKGQKKKRKLTEILKSDKIFDIGPETIRLYMRIVRGAKTVLWNGPMGCFEKKDFEEGTFTLVEEILKGRARSMVGGGETGQAMRKKIGKKETPKRIFISTGGGAMLDFLGGKDMPGIQK
jgi:phosphoglycerate kinase